MVDIGGGTWRAEQRRVHRHLAGAEAAARARRVRLDPVRAAVRRLLLDELGGYRRRGRYPHNHCFRAHPAPEFIDAHGTRCAVAHLLEVSGQGELVRHVAATNNNARVPELARSPELRAWLAAAGLSASEAAAIQPSYCYQTQAEVCFCNQNPESGLAVGTIIDVRGDAVHVRIDRVEGRLGPVQVGDEYTLDRAGKLGEQIFLGRVEDVLYRRSEDLVINGAEVRCQYSEATLARPVSIDTVIEALLASPVGCIDVLATDHSGWNQSKCGETSREDGCSVATRAPDANGLELTSAALLAALLWRRLRRR